MKLFKNQIVRQFCGAIVSNLGADGRALQDELSINGAADLEPVFTDLREAVTFIKPLGPEVFRPHADPEISRTVRHEPVQHLGEQAAPVAATLVVLEKIQSLEFSTGRRHPLVRQIARAGQSIADCLAVQLNQPLGLGLISEISARAVEPVPLSTECRQIIRVIEMTEGLGKGFRA